MAAGLRSELQEAVPQPIPPRENVCQSSSIKGSSETDGITIKSASLHAGQGTKGQQTAETWPHSAKGVIIMPLQVACHPDCYRDSVYLQP